MPQDNSSLYKTQRRIDGWRIAACSLISATAWAWLCGSAGAAVIHKHRIHLHQAVHGSFNPAATALAPRFTIVPAAPAAKSDDDKYEGLSRNRDDCNYGCIDN